MTTIAPSIAIVVPNYNDSKHVIRGLSSILSQEVLPDQFIVVDDCSTDNSIEVIKLVVSDYPWVKIVRNPKNLGVISTLTVGAQLASTDYIMFVASNDFILPGVFARAKKCLAHHPDVGLWSAMGWLVNEEDDPIRPLPVAVPALSDRYFSPVDCIAMAKRLGNWFAGPTVIYHRTTFTSVGGFNPDYLGFTDLVCALMVASKRGAIFSPIPYAVFRLHEGSYLSNTLANPEILVPLINQLSHQAPDIAPELFNKDFCQRTTRRFVFAAIRASEGQLLTAYEAIIPSSLTRWLVLLQRYIPAGFGFLRVVGAFVILRPFDIWPSIWNRCAGTALLAMRERRNVKFALARQR